MKFQKPFVAASLTFLIASSALGGGSSDGTGNLFTPTEQQVVDSVAPAAMILWTATSDFRPVPATGKVDFGAVVPQDLQFMFTLEYSSWALNLIMSSTQGASNPYDNIEFRKKGLCDGPDGTTGAGSIITIGGKPHLCLSLEKLKTIPVDYLVPELAILLAHEVSHIVGKDEITAQKVQKFFAAYNKVRLELTAFATFSDSGNPGPGFTLRGLALGLENATPETLCKPSSWGNLSDVDKGIRSLRYKLGFTSIQFPDVNQKEYWARRAAMVIGQACDSHSDPANLKKLVSAFQKDAGDFINQLGWPIPQEIYR